MAIIQRKQCTLKRVTRWRHHWERAKKRYGVPSSWKRYGVSLPWALQESLLEATSGTLRGLDSQFQTAQSAIIGLPVSYRTYRRDNNLPIEIFRCSCLLTITQATRQARALHGCCITWQTRYTNCKYNTYYTSHAAWLGIANTPLPITVNTSYRDSRLVWQEYFVT